MTADVNARPTPREGVADPAIVVEHAVKEYGKLTAVSDVSFTVAAGETLGLLGPNGAGKSTLIRMMTTLVPITSGRVLVGGHDVTREPDAARLKIGVIPQAMTTDTDLSVEENLSIYAKLYGVQKEERTRAMDELLELVHLADRRKSLVGTLSGGMRRRAELARGLVHSPDILFLDEPTTGLDPVSRADVWEMITKLRQARGLTVLITTHYMDEADRLCDRIAIVDKGKLVALDTPRALKDAVPGATAIEVSVDRTPDNWESELLSLDGVESAHALGGNTWRLVVGDAGGSATALVTHAQRRGVALQSLSVTSTTLDDVFAHYTGHALR
ncbi:MAG TPA: ABC transporter ATP-binding protein [Gemmatimonadaceae bacterium]|nr:ABC transporter ATP-binding protein [Gemmatimonadaceae bacterium]